MTDAADTYLFSRGRRVSDWVSDDPESMVGMMFFDLWATRQQPFATLKDGDNMLLFDTSTRRLIWHLRATAVTKREYHSIPQALDIIREAFGLIPNNLTNHWVGKRDHGYVLAWAVDVIQPLNIKIHDGFTMGRNGYLPFDKIPANKRPTIPAFNPDNVLSRPLAYVGGIDLREPGTRYIPQSVRDEVKKRDNNRCVTCQRQPPEVVLHYDHKWPFSRGGTNNADNIQMLCAEHNLRKSAAVLDGAIPPPDLTLRAALQMKLGLYNDSSLSDLINAANLADEEVTELLIDEATLGDPEAVEKFLTERPELPTADLVLSWVASGYDIDGETDRALRIANELLNSTDTHAATRAALLKWHLVDDATPELLERAIESTDPSTRSEAASCLAEGEEDDTRRINLLRIALRDGDGSIRASAALDIVESGNRLEHDELFDLLAVARTSDEPHVAAVAVALTGRAILVFDGNAEQALVHLEYAEKSGEPDAIEVAGEVRKEFGLSGPA